MRMRRGRWSTEQDYISRTDGGHLVPWGGFAKMVWRNSLPAVQYSLLECYLCLSEMDWQLRWPETFLSKPRILLGRPLKTDSGHHE